MKKIEAKLKTSKGEWIPLEDWSFRIGAFEGVCNYVLTDEKASPIHGVIEYKGDKWYIQDTNSAAGISINEKKIQPNKPVLLGQNDKITIADTTFTFIMDLELFKSTDMRLINDLYKNWLLESDESMEERYKMEILHIVNERLSALGGEALLPEQSDAAKISESDGNQKSENEELLNRIKEHAKEGINSGEKEETEVLAGDEGGTPTTVLNDAEGDMPTTVLNEETGDLVTTLLSEEEGSAETTVLNEEEEEGETEVLSEEGDENTTVLNEQEQETGVLNAEPHCALERVNSKGGEIDIDTLPFIIGKAMSQVNYCLNEYGVSRRQARIFKGADNAFFISDLDSKNGTFVNGKRIAKNSAMKIKDGDMVSFAEYNFIVSIK